MKLFDTIRTLLALPAQVESLKAENKALQLEIVSLKEADTLSIEKAVDKALRKEFDDLDSAIDRAFEHHDFDYAIDSYLRNNFDISDWDSDIRYMVRDEVGELDELQELERRIDALEERENNGETNVNMEAVQAEVTNMLVASLNQMADNLKRLASSVSATVKA